MINKQLIARFLCTVAIFWLVGQHLFALSPRLLIFHTDECTFAPFDICDHVEATLIDGTSDDLIDQIEALDSADQTHLIVVENYTKSPVDLAFSVQYAHLVLQGSLEKSLKRIDEYLQNLPIIDKDIPPISPEVRGQFYALLMAVDEIFNVYELCYWGISGTLLGAIRHQGMIPWDDDFDLVIHANDTHRLEELKDELEGQGLELLILGNYFYKIYPSDGNYIYDNEGEPYPWKYPFVDVFVINELDEKMCIVSHNYQEIDLYPGWYLLPEEVKDRPQRVPFGPVSLPIPSNPDQILARHYGTNWYTVAYAMRNHILEQDCERIRVQMTDYSPPAYTLP